MNNEERFVQIVREQRQTIYTVCYMFAKEKEEVDDLFQETLINLWKGIDAFRNESKVSTWVWRVALNTCISADRKKKARGETVPLSMNINLYSDSDEKSLQIQQLHKRIGRLGLVDRAIILLWLDNLSYDEIGAIVGISAKNVSVKLVRIREQLKQMSND
ncbi:MAG: sigma-70 family RNA polymerase sigma factor [Prevotellaceae bacterium]|nr:sigma-70 family RNA polymerase sigma factor [Candidatus Minthosoma caballi]